MIRTRTATQITCDVCAVWVQPYGCMAELTLDLHKKRCRDFFSPHWNRITWEFSLQSVKRSRGVLNIVLIPAAVPRGQCELPMAEILFGNRRWNCIGSRIATVWTQAESLKTCSYWCGKVAWSKLCILQYVVTSQVNARSSVCCHANYLLFCTWTIFN